MRIDYKHVWSYISGYIDGSLTAEGRSATEREDLATRIEETLKELPATYREVLLLRDKEDLSIEEIAEIVGVNPGLINVRLFRARMLLQKKLAPHLKQETSAPKRVFSRMGGRQ